MDHTEEWPTKGQAAGPGVRKHGRIRRALQIHIPGAVPGPLVLQILERQLQPQTQQQQQSCPGSAGVQRQLQRTDLSGTAGLVPQRAPQQQPGGNSPQIPQQQHPPGTPQQVLQPTPEAGPVVVRRLLGPLPVQLKTVLRRRVDQSSRPGPPWRLELGPWLGMLAGRQIKVNQAGAVRRRNPAAEGQQQQPRPQQQQQPIQPQVSPTPELLQPPFGGGAAGNHQGRQGQATGQQQQPQGQQRQQVCLQQG